MTVLLIVVIIILLTAMLFWPIPRPAGRRRLRCGVCGLTLQTYAESRGVCQNGHKPMPMEWETDDNWI